MITFLTIYLIYFIIVCISMISTIDEQDTYMDFIKDVTIFNIPLYGHVLYISCIIVHIADKRGKHIPFIEDTIFGWYDQIENHLNKPIKKRKYEK